VTLKNVVGKTSRCCNTCGSSILTDASLSLKELRPNGNVVGLGAIGSIIKSDAGNVVHGETIVVATAV